MRPKNVPLLHTEHLKLLARLGGEAGRSGLVLPSSRDAPRLATSLLTCDLQLGLSDRDPGGWFELLAGVSGEAGRSGLVELLARLGDGTNPKWFACVTHGVDEASWLRGWIPGPVEAIEGSVASSAHD
jgi:hypothetical protein